MDSDCELHAIDGYIETIYLAVYREKILVLDCGCSCDAETIVSYVENELNRSPEAIKLAVASHAHPDHVGGAKNLRERYGIPVAAPPLINDWYRGLTGAIQHRMDLVLAQYVALSTRKRLRSIWFERTIRYDFALEEGKPLPFFQDWTVIETPGHTDHDVALYHRDSGVLYAADLIVKTGADYTPPIPVISAPQIKAALDRIERLEVRRLALAHRGPQEVDCFESVIGALREQLDRNITYKLVSRMVAPFRASRRDKDRDG